MTEEAMKAKRCILVAASDFNEAAFRSLVRPGDAVVAVDGGYASIVACGMRPCASIGDFDSLGFVPEGECVLRYPCEKDASDLELALEWAFERGFRHVAVFGALGGRLDQTMATLQTLHGMAKRGMDVFAVGKDCCVSIVVGGCVQGDGDQDGSAGILDLPAGFRGTVSVFSLCDVSRGVSEAGLLYALEGADLPNTVSLGLSNEFTGRASRISVECGALAVFLPVDAAAWL